jgi:hypothetical protein
MRPSGRADTDHDGVCARELRARASVEGAYPDVMESLLWRISRSGIAAEVRDSSAQPQKSREQQQQLACWKWTMSRACRSRALRAGYDTTAADEEGLMSPRLAVGPDRFDFRCPGSLASRCA